MASISRAATGACSGAQMRSPRPTSRSSASRTATDSGGTASSRVPSKVSIAAIVVCAPAGSTVTASPTASVPPASWPAYVRSSSRPPRGRIVHCTGSRSASRVGSARTSTSSRCSSSSGPSYQGDVVRAVDDVVAVQRRDRDHARVGDVEALGQLPELGLDLAEAVLVPVDEVHLVHARDDVLDPEQRRQRGVAARLVDDPAARVEQDQGEVRGRGAGDHVARVALVARGVGDDERALLGLEEAVGDVDRDALLALGAQAVGDRGEVGAVAVARARVERLEVVLEDQLGVEQQAADQRRLAVVDGAGGGEAQEVH